MPLQFIKQIIRNETFQGSLLVLMGMVALIISNSDARDYYQHILHTKQFFGYAVNHPIAYWVNHGLMSLFFLQVGLEIKAELIEGQLNSKQKAMLPAIAALGGMIMPALIFMLINMNHREAWSAWSVPVATDIAFSLAVLQLVAKRIPVTLKLFLLALAVFDDLGAVIIIAVFYTQTIHWIMLLFAAIILLVLAALNYFRVSLLSVYLLVGLLLWYCVAKSGIDAAVSGVILALFVPLQLPNSPLHLLYEKLTPWVVYLILPIFAFVNAGVDFASLTKSDMMASLPMGIALALIIGKPLGVMSFCYSAVKLNLAKLSDTLNWSNLFGISLLCGVGFTMSLLLSELAFKDSAAVMLSQVKFGVLAGSAISGLLGYLWLRR